MLAIILLDFHTIPLSPSSTEFWAEPSKVSTCGEVSNFDRKGRFCQNNKHKYPEVKPSCASIKIDPNYRHRVQVITWWRMKHRFCYQAFIGLTPRNAQKPGFLVHRFCSQAFTQQALTSWFIQLLDGWWRWLVIGEGFDDFGDRFGNKCLDKLIPSV